MTSSITQIRREEKGFTLVELAIVMIIIGLLIGGILKGQELIVNAQITNAISQIKGLDGAVATFRDSYNAFPGDMSNATTRIAACSGAPAVATCGNGDGDGRIDSGVGDAPAAATESVYFFAQLLGADLITTMDGTNVPAALAFGRQLPAASIGGGYTVGHTNPNAGAVDVTGFSTAGTAFRAGHYIVLTGTPAAVTAGSGVITPSQAARIDRKLDDGLPSSGTVHGTNQGTCVAAGVYAEINQGQLCAIAVRIQG